MAKQEQGFVPPYISFSTLTGLFEKMENQPPPPRIDRSYLDNMSGGYQTAVITSLKSLDLIGEAGEITPGLIEIVQNPELRPKAIGELVREKYKTAISLAEQNATQGQLEEVFKGYGFTGDTLRKAIAFFLHACNYSSITVSPHFRVPKRIRSANRRGAGKSSATTPETPAEQPETPVQQQTSGDTLSITLASGTKITLTVDKTILSLNRTERQIVLDIVDSMQEHDVADEDDEDEDVETL